MKLSDHFQLAEFEHTDTKLPNPVPSGLILRLRDLCLHILEPIRAEFGPVTILSGYRSPAVNRAVGGAPSSQHLRGEAADIEVGGLPNDQLAAWIAETLAFDQLILEAHRDGEPFSGWVHVSWTSARALRRSLLTMRPGAHGPVFSPGLAVPCRPTPALSHT